MIGSADLIRQLPGNYEASTTPAERLAHFELYKRFEAVDGFVNGDVLLSWNRMDDGSAHVLLHAVFRDTVGSLSTATSALADRSVDVKRVSAFCTPSGVAVDTFELSRFDNHAAEHLKAVLSRMIADSGNESGRTPRRAASMLRRLLPKSASGAPSAGSILTNSDELTRQLPANYVTTTTPAERLAHIELFRQYNDRSLRETAGGIAGSAAGVDGDAELSWTPVGDGTTHVHLHAVFRDAIGSLSTVTAVLTECGINIVRVSAFSTTSGIAINTFELSDFDEPSADLLRARLNALVHGGDPEAAFLQPTANKYSANAVAFRVSWRGSLGFKRARQEFLIGDNWAAIGPATMESEDFHFVQPDFHDGSSLHVGFEHKRQMRNLVITFVDGHEQCTRAVALLARFVVPTNRSITDSQRLVATRKGASQFGSATLEMPTLAPLSRWCTCAFHFPGGKERWLLIVLIVALVALVLGASLALHIHLTWAYLAPSKYDLATCLVAHPHLGVDHLDADQKCYGHPAECYRSFFVVHPQWRVSVASLLHTYDSTALVSKPPTADPLAGKAVAAETCIGDNAFVALAVPSARLPHRDARKNSIRSGVWCAGDLGWNANRTLHYCLSRARDWMPEIHARTAYPCYVRRRDHETVFFDIEPPHTHSIEAAVACVSSSIGVLGAVVFLHIQWTLWSAPRRLQSTHAQANSELM